MSMLEDDQRLCAALDDIGEMILETRKYYKRLREQYKENEENRDYEITQLEIRNMQLYAELLEVKQLLQEAEAGKPTQ